MKNNNQNKEVEMKNLLNTIMIACTLMLGSTFLSSPVEGILQASECGTTCGEHGCPGGDVNCAEIECATGAKVTCFKGAS